MSKKQRKKESFLPPWINMTERQFKARKRKEFNEALRALRKLRQGCAFMPHPKDFYIGDIADEMMKAKKEFIKWWGKA
jgi:primosomal protein N'